MAGFKQRIAAHRTVGIDTVAFIYHFEQNEQYFPLTQSLFRAVLQGEIAALTSVITLTEVVVLPLRQKKIGVARSYETAILHFPHLRVTNITRHTARAAAGLRAEYRLAVPDALQLASAIQYGATAFVTNDKQMRRLSNLIELFVLDDFV